MKNTRHKSSPAVNIAAHVWLASQATVIGDATIDPDSVVAAGAIVKGDLPVCFVASGIPARIIKEKYLEPDLMNDMALNEFALY